MIDVLQLWRENYVILCNLMHAINIRQTHLVRKKKIYTVLGLFILFFPIR